MSDLPDIPYDLDGSYVYYFSQDSNNRDDFIRIGLDISSSWGTYLSFGMIKSDFTFNYDVEFNPIMLIDLTIFIEDELSKERNSGSKGIKLIPKKYYSKDKYIPFLKKYLPNDIVQIKGDGIKFEVQNSSKIIEKPIKKVRDGMITKIKYLPNFIK